MANQELQPPPALGVDCMLDIPMGKHLINSRHGRARNTKHMSTSVFAVFIDGSSLDSHTHTARVGGLSDLYRGSVVSDVKMSLLFL